MKNLKKSVIAAITLITLNHHSFAQETALNMHSAISGSIPASPVPAVGVAGATTFNVSLKALKDFEKNYKGLAQPLWSPSGGGGFTATLKAGATTTYVCYNKKGNWQYTLKRYSEDQLDHTIKAIVMPRYYGYRINGIAELSLPHQDIYLLYLQDDHNYKTIRVMDGVPDEIEWIKDNKVMTL